MKKLLSIMMVVGALLLAVNAQANLIIQNTQPCAYTVYVFEAIPGTCNLTAQYIPVVVPPLGITNYACTPGSWVVGVCIEELAPVPFLPPMFNCIGLSNAALGGSCANFPAMAFGVGSCGANPVFVQGFPSNLFI